MRNDVLLKLSKEEDYFIFLRENPDWHIKLSLYGETELNNFFEEYKLKRRKRFVDKVDDFTMLMTLIKELM